MKQISHILGLLFLLYSLLQLAKHEVVNLSYASKQHDQAAQNQLDLLIASASDEAISVANPTVPFPIYHNAVHKSHFDVYKKNLAFLLKAFAYISPFLRNVFYMFVSINAP